MGPVLPLHIAAGSLALVAGGVALFSSKGGRLHRKSGMLFFYSMLGLGLSGAGIAGMAGGEGSTIAGLLVTYLVTTALTTVRPPFPGSRWVAVGLMTMAFALGATSVTLGVVTLGTPSRTLDGIPAVIFFKFGIVALIAAVSDLRVIRAGALEGARRLARHLWRMCFALYVASASFFLGQADEIPEPLRITPLLALLAFLPLLVMVYWLRRVRRRPRTSRGTVAVGAAEPAPNTRWSS